MMSLLLFCNILILSVFLFNSVLFSKLNPFFVYMFFHEFIDCFDLGPQFCLHHSSWLFVCFSLLFLIIKILLWIASSLIRNQPLFLHRIYFLPVVPYLLLVRVSSGLIDPWWIITCPFYVIAEILSDISFFLSCKCIIFILD